MKMLSTLLALFCTQALAATSPDLNGDGFVSIKDVGVMSVDFPTDNPRSDLNNDGKVNRADFNILQFYRSKGWPLKLELTWARPTHSVTTLSPAPISHYNVFSNGAFRVSTTTPNVTLQLAATRPATYLITVTTVAGKEGLPTAQMSVVLP